MLTLYSNGQTSVYHPFPDSAAVWNIEADWPCPQVINLYADFSITITGDTLISGQIYHKLSTPYVVQYYHINGCGGEGPGYRGAIRQDKAIKKVFIVQPLDTLEKLLYDFNMNVGDTVKGVVESGALIKDTVQSIDSVLVGSSYRKRWNITYGISFVEGIGSEFGLVEYSKNGIIGTFPFYGITCFSQNGVTLYPYYSTNCQLITSINSVDKNSNEIKIYPNPSNGSFTADFDQSIKSIWLTDLLGNIIVKHETNNQTKFNIDNLSSGTYILTAIDKDGRTTKKKIISCP